MTKKFKLESLELGVNDYWLIDQHVQRMENVIERLQDDLKALRAELNRWETCEYVTESICDSGTFTPALCDTCKENKTKEGTK